MLMMTRRLQNGTILFFIVPIIREGSILKTLLTLVTLKGVERYLQHICATCWRENQKKLYHPECSKDCLHQDEWLEFKSSPDVTSSILNPLADIFLPRYVSNELTDYVNIPFKEKCELFCKKHSIYKLISDYAVNCKNSNTEPKLCSYTKFIDVKNIAQEKLNDFQFNKLRFMNKLENLVHTII
jgi:hypothetical protein